MNSDFLSIGFIGSGSTATAISNGLNNAGYSVVAVASRSEKSAKRLAERLPGCDALTGYSELLEICDVVFLTVPDDAIASVASALPWRHGQAVVHCSGSLTLEVLIAPEKQGAIVGGLHPLQTFLDVDGRGINLRGCTFLIDGHGRILNWLETVVNNMGGYPIQLTPENRPLYHASAVLSSGYVTTLLDCASVLWQVMGFSREDALRALLPLTDQTLRNLEFHGSVLGATGPIVRGDIGTIRQHLDALLERSPSIIPLYCYAGQAMTYTAQERGSIDVHKADEITQLLRSYLDRHLDGVNV
jgi:predicted short-subunit dehydrogenase-like oxidoreductase (DUF2520 family)